MDDKLIRVEVVYALAHDQRVVELFVPEGTTVFQAAERSGLVAHFPEIDLESAPMGLFSKLVKQPKTQVLRENDRVEIYRPLIADPKKARANRAAKQ
ncbi:RnfH family protein [Oceanospirillum multiglobuliferum]|uniref:UPF0125 protein BTE48_11695 n=1 Tax=Oceanospirillum multiglobuliferum TaxID=64969 RepID=A0A1V4T2N4_9GAMM|nr:RnfH family protein [Oceanospirillum multiglobuliferum]OPX54875.1 RnfH family protein [Oceanospirillum multiglobuliferum]